MPDSARSPRSQLSTPRAGNGVRVGGAAQVLIDQSKREEFSPTNGLRLLHKHLVRQAWSVETNSSELSSQVLERCKLLILPCPKAKFYTEELDSLRSFVKTRGGSVLLMLTEGTLSGSEQRLSNIASLLEEFGVAGNSDSVIRTIFYKYFNPKEALIPNGVINRALAPTSAVAIIGDGERNERLGSALTSRNSIRGLREAGTNAGDTQAVDEDNFRSALSFVYPFGCTLSVGKDAVPVLSTGTVCYPVNRPICALHKSESGGKVAVLGSVHMFADEYLEKEDNMKILDIVLKYLTEEVALNPIDAADPDIADMLTIPDNIQLSQTIKMCLQESEVEQTVHGDFIKLLDSTLHFIGLENWPEAIKSYERLGLRHEPLTLVPPIFEVPQPPLLPATFPPAFREIQPPELELFDLDDAFTSTEQRLAQLTNRCADQDLDLFVREAGELIGLGKHVTAHEKGAKRVLERVLREIIRYKSSGLDDSDVPGGGEGGVPYADFHHELDEDGAEPVIGHATALIAMEPYEGDEGDEGEDGANYFSDIDEYDNIDMADT